MPRNRRIEPGAVIKTDFLAGGLGGLLILSAILIAVVAITWSTLPASLSFEIMGTRIEGNVIALAFAGLLLLVGVRLIWKVLHFAVELYREDRQVHRRAGDAGTVTAAGADAAGKKNAPPSAGELEVRLKELEYEYTLSREALRHGFPKTLAAMISGFASLVVAALVFVTSGPGFISGTHLIIMFAILAGALIVYFSFVFARVASLRAEISETKKLIEISSGGKAR